MSHSCQAIIISCIDFRFQSAVREFAQKMGLTDNYDLLSIAGAGKMLNDPSTANLILNQIDISSRLHNIKELILLHHEDCGAYGGRSAFNNSVEKEHENHLFEMAKEEALIKDRFPHLKVKKFIIRLDSTGQKEAQEV